MLYFTILFAHFAGIGDAFLALTQAPVRSPFAGPSAGPPARPPARPEQSISSVAIRHFSSNTSNPLPRGAQPPHLNSRTWPGQSASADWLGYTLRRSSSGGRVCLTGPRRNPFQAPGPCLPLVPLARLFSSPSRPLSWPPPRRRTVTFLGMAGARSPGPQPQGVHKPTAGRLLADRWRVYA